MTEPTATCETHQQLLDAADRCEAALHEFGDERDEQRRARAHMTRMIDAVRTATLIYKVDPTLADEPNRGRRIADLITELMRWVPREFRNGCRPPGTGPTRTPPASECWDSAIMLCERVTSLAEHARRTLPRDDFGTTAGMHRISWDRLAERGSCVEDAAVSLRSAVVHAANIERPHPKVAELIRLANELGRLAVELDEHDLGNDEMAGVHLSDSQI